jgi:hypothetical protein
LKTGAQIMGDVATGQEFKHAAKTRIVDTINEGIDKILPPQGEQGSRVLESEGEGRKLLAAVAAANVGISV